MMDSCINYDVILATFCQPLVAKPHQITCHSNVLKCYNYVAILLCSFHCFFNFLIYIYIFKFYSLTSRAEFHSAKAIMDGFGGADLTISKLRQKKWS